MTFWFWLVILGLLAGFIWVGVHQVRLERNIARLKKEWEDAL